MKQHGLLFRTAEGWLRVENLLFSFWAMFWTLNGLDKFFDGRVVRDRRWGTHTEGWFGVNREAEFTHYFDRLDLPRELALGTLYTLASLEILLGLIFCTMLFSRTPKVVHRMAFKSSLLMFAVFMGGDILFGERQELWEHGTFMILVIITFRLYLDRDVIRQEVLRELRATRHLDPTATREFDRLLHQTTDLPDADQAPAEHDINT